VGVGIGNNETEAFENAWKDAIRSSLHRGGLVEFSQQALEGEITANRIPRNIRCRTQPIRTGDGQIRMYVLVQVPRRRASDIPEDLFFDCRDERFDRDLDRWHNRQKKSQNDNFFSKGRDNYLALGILNVGYPLTLGTNFTGRHGGIIGIGYYLDFGWGIGGKSTYNGSKKMGVSGGAGKLISTLHYSVGVKFFPYKNIFISAGYGTLGNERTHTFNHSNGNFGTDGYRQGKGLILMAGYNLLGNLSKGNGAFLSIGGGMQYDLFTEKWTPCANLRFGVAWKLIN